MFQEEQIIEFLNRIINAEEVNLEDIKTNVMKFYEYLILTKMCKQTTLEKVKRVIDSLDSILAIRVNFGYIDISNIIKQTKENLIQKPEDQKRYVKRYTTPQEERHYSHYSERYSSSCGSNITRERC